MTDLDEVTRLFGEAYAEAKKTEGQKKHMQERLFEAFTEALASGVLAQRLVLFTPDMGDPKHFVDQRCPGWIFVDQKDDHILIEEDPSLMKFQYVNDRDGMVYARTITESGPSMDDETLRISDPELWSEISEWPDPWYSLMKEAINRFEGFECESTPIIDALFTEHGFTKTITDPNRWTTDQLERVKPYMYPAKINTRLVPPRKATAEELGDV